MTVLLRYRAWPAPQATFPPRPSRPLPPGRARRIAPPLAVTVAIPLVELTTLERPTEHTPVATAGARRAGKPRERFPPEQPHLNRVAAS